MNDLEILEMAFKEWLRFYECRVTERWDRLSLSEVDTLASVQWKEFQERYDDYKKASTSSLSSGTAQAATSTDSLDAQA